MKDFCYLRPRDYFKDKCRDISPLGPTSPITTRFMLFQIICTNKFNWDDPLPNDLLKEWINLLEKLRSLRILRRLNDFIKVKQIKTTVINLL